MARGQTAAHNDGPITHEMGAMADKFHVVLSTCPTKESAEQLANRIVQAELAACVSVIPGLRSYYRWHGKVESSDEHLLLIKSRIDVFDALQSLITSQHPYELPEIIAVPITTGSAPYLDWLDASVRKTP